MLISTVFSIPITSLIGAAPFATPNAPLRTSGEEQQLPATPISPSAKSGKLKLSFTDVVMLPVPINSFSIAGTVNAVVATDASSSGTALKIPLLSPSFCCKQAERNASSPFVTLLDCAEAVAAASPCEPFFHADGGLEPGLKSDEFMTASCGGPYCRVIEEDDEKAEFTIARKCGKNEGLEWRALHAKEQYVFKPPACLGGERLSTNNGFTFKKASRIFVGKGKFLVRGCIISMEPQRLLACKMKCCGDWHFLPLTCKVSVPAEGLTVAAEIDHVCLTRLFKVPSSEFWDDHEFYSDCDSAAPCKKKVEAFKAINNLKNLTVLMSKRKEDVYLISALLL